MFRKVLWWTGIERVFPDSKFLSLRSKKCQKWFGDLLDLRLLTAFSTGVPTGGPTPPLTTLQLHPPPRCPQIRYKEVSGPEIGDVSRPEVGQLLVQSLFNQMVVSVVFARCSTMLGSVVAEGLLVGAWILERSVIVPRCCGQLRVDLAVHQLSSVYRLRTRFHRFRSSTSSNCKVPRQLSVSGGGGHGRLRSAARDPCPPQVVLSDR